jgi:hypothetical protein
MFAVRRSDLPEVKNRIRRFKREMVAFLGRKGALPDDVYQLAVSYFPITKGEES